MFSKPQLGWLIARFWGLTLAGGLLWASLLLTLSQNWPLLWAGQPLPSWLTACYLTGLYLGLWALIARFYRSLGQSGPASGPVTELLKGLAAAALLLVGLGGGAYLLGWFDMLLMEGPLARLLLQNLLLGLGVALLEERLFRGLMLDLWELRHGSWQANFFQALLFAGLHLLKRPENLWLHLLYGLNLVLAGYLLGKLRLKQAGLGMSTGLHAGWIWICVYFEQSRGLLWNPQACLWSGCGNPIQGLSGSLLLVGLLLLWQYFETLTRTSEPV